MSSPAYARWETFVGVVGVISAIPLIITLVMMHLPSRRVNSLFKTLDAAETLLQESVEEGVLREYHIQRFREVLAALRDRAREVRARVHSARGCTDDFANLLKGLTTTITCIEDEAKDVRATIATTSTREREERARAEAARRLAAEGGATTDHDTVACAPRLYTRVWRFLRSTPQCVARLPWRRFSSPPGAQENMPQDPKDSPRGSTSRTSPALSLPESARRPSFSERRKSRNKASLRDRAFAHFARDYCQKYIIPSRAANVMHAPPKEISLIELIRAEDGEWVDLESHKVRVRA